MPMSSQDKKRKCRLCRRKDRGDFQTYTKKKLNNLTRPGVHSESRLEEKRRLSQRQGKGLKVNPFGSGGRISARIKPDLASHLEKRRGVFSRQGGGEKDNVGSAAFSQGKKAVGAESRLNL